MEASFKKYPLITLGDIKLRGILTQGGTKAQVPNSRFEYKPIKNTDLIKIGLFVN